MTTDIVTTIADKGVLVLGHPNALDPTNLASDLIGLAWQHDATVVAVNDEALPTSFFDLRSGLIGEVSQKCANYRVTLAVLGDVTGYMRQSKAFTDYVYETN